MPTGATARMKSIIVANILLTSVSISKNLYRLKNIIVPIILISKNYHHQPRLKISFLVANLWLNYSVRYFSILSIKPLNEIVLIIKNIDIIGFFIYLYSLLSIVSKIIYSVPPFLIYSLRVIQKPPYIEVSKVVRRGSYILYRDRK